MDLSRYGVRFSTQGQTLVLFEVNKEKSGANGKTMYYAFALLYYSKEGETCLRRKTLQAPLCFESLLWHGTKLEVIAFADLL
jgi:hypothetical protein